MRWIIRRRPGREVGQRAAPDLLVHLGELTADDRGAVSAMRGAEFLQGLGEPARRLEEHLGAGVGGEVGEPPFPLARLAGREPLEAEPVRGQAGNRERGRDRGWPRDRGHRDPCRRGGGDQAVAGVADPWHPGIGDHEDVPARLELAHQVGGAARLDDVVVRDDAPGQPHAQRRGEAAHPAGVLCGYHVGAFQFRRQPG